MPRGQPACPTSLLPGLSSLLEWRQFKKGSHLCWNSTQLEPFMESPICALAPALAVFSDHFIHLFLALRSWAPYFALGLLFYLKNRANNPYLGRFLWSLNSIGYIK